MTVKKSVHLKILWGLGGLYDCLCYTNVPSALHFGPHENPTVTLRLPFWNLSRKFLVGHLQHVLFFPLGHSEVKL